MASDGYTLLLPPLPRVLLVFLFDETIRPPRDVLGIASRRALMEAA